VLAPDPTDSVVGIVLVSCEPEFAFFAYHVEDLRLWVSRYISKMGRSNSPRQHHRSGKGN
jgi:hypothetical protein